jgi:predicted metal-dependent enzyme (double-stranded beta helix superfamily)
MDASELLRGTARDLPAVIAELDRAVHRDAELAERLASVAATIGEAASSTDLLAPRHLRSSPDQYRTNVVHVAPDGSFSVVALVWRPGQCTPIHSHRSWCVVGVVCGTERETTYRRVAGGVEAVDAYTFTAGQTTWVADDRAVHAVENVGDDIAVSLHVYGVDYAAVGSSILETWS